MMTVNEALMRMRTKMRMKSAVQSFSTEDLLSFLDESLPHIMAAAVTHDVDRFVVRRLKSEMSVVATKYNDKWRLRFEEPFFYLRKMAQVGSTTTIRLRNTDIGQPLAFWSYYGSLSETADWAIVADREILLGTDPSGFDFEIWYVPKVPPLLAFEATGGDTSSVTGNVNALGNSGLGRMLTRRGTYNGAAFRVTEALRGPGEPSVPGAPQDEVFTVKSSAVSTYPSLVLTFEEPLTAALQAGDKVEMLLPFRDHGDDLAILEAVSRAMDAEGNAKRKEMNQQTKGEAHQVYSVSTDPSKAEARYVRYLPR